MDLEILYFEQLKNHIQAQYLKNHTPTFDEISKWKGIDIIYFQEDLRKVAKGNISEKSFYTYFKTSPIKKLPRIDILNILCIYIGYESWADFKKYNKISSSTEEKNSIVQKQEQEQEEVKSLTPTNIIINKKEDNKSIENSNKKTILQKINTDNQSITKNISFFKYSKFLWISFILLIILSVFFAIFKNRIFGKTYTYCFSDADRSAGIKTHIEIKVFKENESPLIYKIPAGRCFEYHTKDKFLKMEISSPFYENITINRSLENASEKELIELKPDDYKFAFYYFSLKDTENSKEIINQKRKELEKRISDNAVIKQIYDNDIYGVETISKEKYITLVTTPTTSLKNLNLIEMKRDENGKIISIKFKITNNENQ